MQHRGTRVPAQVACSAELSGDELGQAPLEPLAGVEKRWDWAWSGGPAGWEALGVHAGAHVLGDSWR